MKKKELIKEVEKLRKSFGVLSATFVLKYMVIAVIGMMAEIIYLLCTPFEQPMTFTISVITFSFLLLLLIIEAFSAVLLWVFWKPKNQEEKKEIDP